MTANMKIQRTSRIHAALRCAAITALSVSSMAAIAAADGASGDCTPFWSDEIPSYGTPNDMVKAMAQFHGRLVNGTHDGPMLFVSGHFQHFQKYDRHFPAPARRIAMWTGHEWQALGSGLGGGEARGLAVYDDGNGPALYAGGLFSTAGDQPASRIARWDGQEWSPVGGGVNFMVWTMAVHDDGSGPALYVGGTFTVAGGIPANRLARWDGEQWSAVGDGLNAPVYALTTYNDGKGERLIVGGAFTEAGGVPANRIASWDGEKFEPIGDGFDSVVRALTIMDGEMGPTLVAGGSFTQSGETQTKRIAQWTGDGWQQVGNGFDSGGVVDLEFADIGNGPTLFVIGQSLDIGACIAELVDGVWQAVGGNMNPNTCFKITVFDGGSGPELIAGGRFVPSGALDSLPLHVMRWKGEYWTAVGDGVRSIDGLFAATYFDDGDGEQLYVGGWIHGAGGLASPGLVRWDGENFSSIGSINQQPVYAIYRSDREQMLYAGGFFTEIDGKPMSHIAGWDGSTWSPLGAGVVEGDSWTAVHAMTEFDDGSSPKVFVGGSFTTAGDIDASNIAAWDGEQWHALGSGVDGRVHHMVVFDDGDGTSLYVCGAFSTAGDVDAPGLARWDGKKWHPVAEVTANHWTRCPLAVYDGKLIVGETVTLSDGSSYGPVASFDGESWSALNDGLSHIPYWFEILNDGNGPTLYVGRSVSHSTGSVLLRWNGSQWEVPPWGGISTNLPAEFYYVRAMAVSSSGDELAVGGRFNLAGDVQSMNLAILKGCPAHIPGDLNGDGVVDQLDLIILLAAWGPCPDPKRGDCPADLNGDGIVDGRDLLILLANWG